MALQGTLGDFAVADILQLIGQQQKSGVLRLTIPEEEVRIFFRDGSIVRAETSSRDEKDRLGEMLVRSELVTRPQLEAALAEQRRTLRKLGDLLVEDGAISRSDLRQMGQLQLTETLYRLFGLKQGDYAFEQTEVEVDPNDAGLASVRSESVLMEGFRRVDEWPGVRKVITSPRMRFEKKRPLPDPPAKKKDEDDFNLDAAFGGGDAPSTKDGIGTNERKVYDLANTKRTAQQICDLSRLGEFEGCKALMTLVSGGYLEVLQVSEGETAEGPRKRRLIDVLRERLGTALATLALVMVATWFGGKLLPMAGPVDAAVSDPAVQRFLAQGQVQRLGRAIETYRHLHGALPERLDTLVEEHLITEGDLSFPWREPYLFQRDAKGGGWQLVSPLR